MRIALVSLLGRLTGCATRGLGSASGRFAIVVGIAVAIGSSAHAAAAPFEGRVAGTGPDVLLIPGLASSGAVWDDTRTPVPVARGRTHRDVAGRPPLHHAGRPGVVRGHAGRVHSPGLARTTRHRKQLNFDRTWT